MQVGIHIAQFKGIQVVLHRGLRNFRFIIKPRPESVTVDLTGPSWNQRHLELVAPKRLACEIQVDVDPSLILR